MRGSTVMRGSETTPAPMPPARSATKARGGVRCCATPRANKSIRATEVDGVDPNLGNLASDDRAAPSPPSNEEYLKSSAGGNPQMGAGANGCEASPLSAPSPPSASDMRQLDRDAQGNGASEGGAAEPVARHNGPSKIHGERALYVSGGTGRDAAATAAIRDYDMAECSDDEALIGFASSEDEELLASTALVPETTAPWLLRHDIVEVESGSEGVASAVDEDKLNEVAAAVRVLSRGSLTAGGITGGAEVETEEPKTEIGAETDAELELELAVRDIVSELKRADVEGIDVERHIQTLIRQGRVDVNQPDVVGDTALMLAAESGRATLVTLLLAHKADCHARSSDGMTSLMLAAQRSHADVVEILLLAGSLVDAISNDGCTALMLAAPNPDTACVQMLLAHGAAIDAGVHHDGHTTLTCAALYGHVSCMALLLAYGAEVDYDGNNEGKTALMYTAQKGHAACAALLLANGAVVDARSSDGQTPLLLAIIGGHTSCAELLLKHGADPELLDYDGDKPLMIAARRCRQSCVGLLLDHGAEVDAQSPSGHTALHTAAFDGDMHIMKLLLKAGASVDVENNSGHKPLHAAASSGNEDAVDLLLRAGAPLNATTKSGSVPLCIAAQQGNRAVVAILLSEGAALNVVDNDGATALHIASQNGALDIVEQLLNGGAIVDVLDKSGHTPLLVAARNDQARVLGKLLAAGAAVETPSEMPPLYIAARDGIEHAVQLLLRASAEVDKPNAEGLTPLHAAASRGHEAALRALLEGGAVATNSIEGKPILSFAVQNGRAKCAALLLQFGADADACDSRDGETALMIAASKGDSEICQLLLENGGAAVDKFNNDGLTALMSAAARGHTDVVKIMLDNDASIDLRSTGNGQTALMYASAHGHIAAAALLLLKKASVDVADNGGLRAISYAAMNGRAAVAELLLSHGASGAGAAAYAVRGGHLPLAQRIGLDVGAAMAEEEAAVATRRASGALALRRVRGQPGAGLQLLPDGTVQFGRGYDSVGVPEAAAKRGRVFYEVELTAYSSCTSQFGWAAVGWDGHASKAKDCSGVGDDRGSWAIDGTRLKRWGVGAPVAPNQQPSSEELSPPTTPQRLGRQRIRHRHAGKRNGAAVVLFRNSNRLECCNMPDGHDTPCPGATSLPQIPRHDYLDATHVVQGSDFGEPWHVGDTVGFAADLETGRLVFGRNGKFGSPMGCAFDGLRVVGLFPALTGMVSGPGELAVRPNFGERSWKFGPPDETYSSVFWAYRSDTVLAAAAAAAAAAARTPTGGGETSRSDWEAGTTSTMRL